MLYKTVIATIIVAILLFLFYLSTLPTNVPENKMPDVAELDNNQFWEGYCSQQDLPAQCTFQNQDQNDFCLRCKTIEKNKTIKSP